MSTGINDVVFELRRELEKQFNQRLMDNQPRLKRFIRDPSLLIEWLKIHAKYIFTDYGREVHSHRRIAAQRMNAANEFTPTDKKFPGTKIAVYTVITGEYDTPADPVYADDEIDYYLIADSKVAENYNGKVWKVIHAPLLQEGLSNAKRNRYMKLHHDETLELTGKKYDYCIYIDGSIRIICDIKPLVYSLIESGKTIALHHHRIRDCIYSERNDIIMQNKAKAKDIDGQLKFYRSEGMPEHFGLFENTVIIRKCNDSKLKDIMHQWWLQVERFTYRDQISLPYVLWKNGLDCSYVFSLGNNVWTNPHFIFYNHNSR